MSESDGKEWPMVDDIVRRRPCEGDAARAYARGLADGAARTLAKIEAEADGYRRRAQAIRVEAEVAEAKADALTGAVAAIRREGAP